MYKENGLKIQPGEQFTTKVNRKKFEIRKICDCGIYARVVDLDTGNEYLYGVEALKRLEVVSEKIDH